MKTPHNSLIPQHKRMAMGKNISANDDDDDFGVEELSETSRGPHPDRGNRNTLKRKDRNAPVVHSRGRSQANPDHGPMEYD